MLVRRLLRQNPTPGLALCQMPRGLRIIHPFVGDRNLTHFGGIFLIQRFCQRLKLKWHLQKNVRFTQRRSRYHPIQLIQAIVYAVIVGISRLSKTSILQGNGAFLQIVGLRTFPYACSLRRFLKRVNLQMLRDIDQVHDQLRHALFYVPRPRTSLLFDFDSSVLTVYGKLIEGAAVGYNPRKRGARSYHPILGFESHNREFWHGCLRPGNVHTAAGSVEFLRACLAKVPPYVYRLRLRADAGFFGHEFVEALEVAKIGYVIVARMVKPFKRKIATLDYHRFRKDWAVAEFHYQPFGWQQPHRFVVIRRPLPDKEEEQLSLFHTQRYAYQIFVTNLRLQAEKVWYFYRGRAVIELDIRELKESYALAKIPTNRFLANQVYFSLLLLSYNIINWFRRLCLPSKYRNATVETIRRDLLVVPARLVRTHNRNILRLPAEYVSADMLRGISKKIDAIKLKQS
jgi:hypothetical protein